MNSKPFLPLVIAALVAVAADKPNTSGVIHLDQDKVADMFTHGGTLLATNNFKVMALRRDQPGEVEIHDRDTDIIYVLDGSATFVTGGSAIGPRSTGPDEARAKNIEGGEERTLTKGDVIIIPNRVPHWFKAVKGPFLYYVVKVAR
jgi:mannose-6-phosphate isomerase-like protein (cupin superfamily)